jgi:hypothetical protein
VQLRYAGVDQHACIGMVDDVHVDRQPLALDEQVGDADRRDGDRGGGVHRVPTAAVADVRVMMTSLTVYWPTYWPTRGRPYRLARPTSNSFGRRPVEPGNSPRLSVQPPL